MQHDYPATRSRRYSRWACVGLLLVLAPMHANARDGSAKPAAGADNETVQLLVRLRGEPAYKAFLQGGGKAAADNAHAVAKRRAGELAKQQDRFVDAVKALGAHERSRIQFIDNVVTLEVDRTRVAELQRQPDVLELAPTRRYQRSHTTSTPLLGAPTVWSSGFVTGSHTGRGITVAVVDEGIDYTHRHFGGAGNYAANDRSVIGDAGVNWPPAGVPTAMGDQLVIGGYDFVGDDYDYGLVAQPDPDPAGCAYSHGTHVAGSVAGYGVTATGDTFTGNLARGEALFPDFPAASLGAFRVGPGVAPQANLVSLVVFGCNGSTGNDTLILALDAAGSQTFLGEDVDVVNMSLGSPDGGNGPDNFLIRAQQALADIGIVVVASAGNSGDVQLVTGSPGVAPTTISVASATDSSGLVSGQLRYLDPATSEPLVIAARRGFMYSVSGPGAFTAGAAIAAPADACTPLVEPTPTAWDGRWLVADRGVCSFSQKLSQVLATGGAGIIVVNNDPGAPFAMSISGDFTDDAPAVMVGQADGAALKLAIAADAGLTATFDDGAFEGATVYSSFAERELLASSFTSRGGVVRGSDGRVLKPNIAGPGQTITSAGAGTDNGGYTISGTSMASPHIAGAVALLIDADGHDPGNAADVARIKQRLMSTATQDLAAVTTGVAPLHSPQRIGAGFADVAAAIETTLLAYASDAADNVALSFGYPRQLVGAPTTISKAITLENLGDSAVTVATGYSARSDWPGARIAVTPDSIEVPAHGSASVQVQLTIDAAHADLNVSGDPLFDSVGNTFLHEQSGYVTFSTGGASPRIIRTAVYAAPSLAANIAAPASIEVSSLTGSASLALTGNGFDLGSDTNDHRSIVSVYRLLATDGVERDLFFDVDRSGSTGPNEALSDYAYADVQYLGGHLAAPANGQRLFHVGLAMFGDWITPRDLQVEVFVDVDDDGSDDYRWYYDADNSDHYPVYYERLQDGAAIDSGDFAQHLNYQSGDQLHTQLLHNRVMALPIVVADSRFADNAWPNYVAGAIRLRVVTRTLDNDDPVQVDSVSAVYAPGIADAAQSTQFAAAPNAFPAMPGQTIAVDYTITRGEAAPAILSLHHHNLDPASRAQISRIVLSDRIFRNGFEQPD